MGLIPLNPPANAGAEGDMSLIPGLPKDPLEDEMATHSGIILA